MRPVIDIGPLADHLWTQKILEKTASSEEEADSEAEISDPPGVMSRSELESLRMSQIVAVLKRLGLSMSQLDDVFDAEDPHTAAVQRALDMLQPHSDRDDASADGTDVDLVANHSSVGCASDEIAVGPRVCEHIVSTQAPLPVMRSTRPSFDRLPCGCRALPTSFRTTSRPQLGRTYSRCRCSQCRSLPSWKKSDPGWWSTS